MSFREARPRFGAGDRVGSAPGLLAAALVLCGLAFFEPAAGAGTDLSAGMPDPARAWEYRDMTPLSAWLASASDAGDPDGDQHGDARRADDLRARAWLARRDGDRDRAVDLIDQAVELAPDRPELRVDRASFRSEAIDDAGAFKSLRIARDVRGDLTHALKVAPDHVDALAALAAFHLRAPGIAGGDRQKAAVLMLRLGELAPARLQFRQAVEHADQARYAEAVRLVGLAISRAGQSPPRWRILEGNWLQRLGDDSGALEAYRRALSAAPRHGGALFEFGRLAADSGRAGDQGIDALKKFLALPSWPGDPAAKRAWWHLGRIQARAGCVEKARAAFSQALDRDPDWREPRQSLEALADRVETPMSGARCG